MLLKILVPSVPQPSLTVTILATLADCLYHTPNDSLREHLDVPQISLTTTILTSRVLLCTVISKNFSSDIKVIQLLDSADAAGYELRLSAKLLLEATPYSDSHRRVIRTAKVGLPLYIFRETVYRHLNLVSSAYFLAEVQVFSATPMH